MPGTVRKYYVVPGETVEPERKLAWLYDRELEMKIRELRTEEANAHNEAAELDRAVTIRQGLGSLLHAAPLGEGRAEVGGRVVLDGVREYPID